MNPFKYRNQPAEAFLWSISHHLLQPESRWINENVSETMWNISESSCCFKEKSNNKNRFRKQLKIYKKRKDGAILVSSVTASSQSEHSRTDRKEHKVTDASSPRLSLLFVPRMQEATDAMHELHELFCFRKTKQTQVRVPDLKGNPAELPDARHKLSYKLKINTCRCLIFIIHSSGCKNSYKVTGKKNY